MGKLYAELEIFLVCALLQIKTLQRFIKNFGDIDLVMDIKTFLSCRTSLLAANKLHEAQCVKF